MSSGPPPFPFAPPPKNGTGVATLLDALQMVHQPVFFDLERAPQQGPRLFVSNHSLYALLDFPHFFWTLYRQRGIFLRSLGHSAHFSVPLWRTLMQRYGVVDASPANCAALFAAGEAVLVFPGGGREAAKQHGESYKLRWKQRKGFARMAIAHGATVVPLACYGAEHAWEIMRDGPELLAGPAGPLLRRVCRQLGARPDEIPPLSFGIGPTPIPRPVRLYFSVGQPINTEHLKGQHDNDDVVWALREQVADEIEQQLKRLAAVRNADPLRGFRQRMKSTL